jgi:hypothetical protein
MNLLRALIVALVILPSSSLKADESLTVQVRETKLRSAPNQWSESVSTLKYGDRVSAVKVEKDWVEGVTSNKKKGFVHVSAMSTKKVVFSGAKVSNSALDPTDVILAGKGFSKATEDEYVKQNAGSNFKAVDSVEALKVADSELRSFMTEGKIGAGVK